MKGKIDINGWLRIERSGKEKLQECPFMQRAFEVNDIVIAPCGDWCPLFGEPYEYDDFNEVAKRVDIRLCQTTLSFKMSDFTDERDSV